MAVSPQPLFNHGSAGQKAGAFDFPGDHQGRRMHDPEAASLVQIVQLKDIAGSSLMIPITRF